MASASAMDEGVDWSSYGEVYDLLRLLLPYTLLQQAVAAMVAASCRLHDPVRVLDLGCGTANLLEHMGHRLPGLCYYGLDASPVMLEQATAKYASSRLATPPQFIEADVSHPASAWRLPHSGFHAVTAVNSLYTLPDPRATIEELAGIVEGDAVLVFSTPAANPQTPNGGPDPAAVIAEHLQLYIAGGGDDPERAQQDLIAIMKQVAAFNATITAASAYHFPTEDELRGWFGPGWQLVHVTKSYGGQNWTGKAVRRI